MSSWWSQAKQQHQLEAFKANRHRQEGHERKSRWTQKCAKEANKTANGVQGQHLLHHKANKQPMVRPHQAHGIKPQHTASIQMALNRAWNYIHLTALHLLLFFDISTDEINILRLTFNKRLLCSSWGAGGGGGGGGKGGRCWATGIKSYENLTKMSCLWDKHQGQIAAELIFFLS